MLTEQEKAFLVDELDEYFDQIQVQTEVSLISEKIVEIIETVLADETLDDQQRELRSRLSHFIWANNIQNGVAVTVQDLQLNGKPFQYNQGDYIDVIQLMRIILRLEDQDFEQETATNADRGEAKANAQDLIRSHKANLSRLKEKVKEFLS
jgi:hypothetical protein